MAASINANRFMKDNSCHAYYKLSSLEATVCTTCTKGLVRLVCKIYIEAVTVVTETSQRMAASMKANRSRRAFASRLASLTIALKP